MKRPKVAKNKDKLQGAVDYLAEYPHVKGAVIADSEGLVVARSGDMKFDAELFSAFALTLAGSVEVHLPRLVPPGLECMILKTREDWIAISRASSFLLVVAADRQVDDLLNIRITRALDMVSSCLKEKYPLVLTEASSNSVESTKSMEEIHV